MTTHPRHSEPSLRDGEESQPLTGERSLPEGWRWAKLGDVSTAIRGITFQSGEAKQKPFDDSIACLTTSGVQDEVNWESRRFIPRRRIPSDKQLLEPGDLLVSTANSKELVGKSCLVTNPPFVCTFGAFVTVLRPKAETVPRILAYWMRTQEAMGYCYQVASNTTNISNLRVSDLLDMRIALPPLPEQRRIAAILQDQLAAVERARAAAEEQLTAAEALPAAYLRAVFNSPEAQQWPQKPFGSLADNLDGRRIPLKQEERRVRKGQYPYYGASGVIDSIDDYLFDGEYLLVSEDGANLVLRSTPIAFKATGKFWVNNHAHVVQPRNGVLLDYLLHFLNRTDLKLYISGMAQPKLTQDDLNSIPVPVPPIAEQQQVVATLSEQMAAAEQARIALQAQLDAISRLPASLLRRAFKGEL
ncbi:MAG TPA: restriction endonuclease subunit S [Anaerolineae bacterium]|nr:restriction endonuclease subunit S [Anaerolineae bacterium]